jgi:hypothetical protein
MKTQTLTSQENNFLKCFPTHIGFFVKLKLKTRTLTSQENNFFKWFPTHRFLRKTQTDSSLPEYPTLQRMSSIPI